MKKSFTHFIFLLLPLLLLSCGGKQTQVATGSRGTGGLAVALQWPSSKYAAPAGVATIRISISGSDMATITQDFPAADGGGTISGVLAGTNRTVSALGLDANGTTLYSGSTSGVTIVGGQTTNVVVVLITAQNGTVFYEEDFAADPNYTSVAPSDVFWDSTNQNYFVRVYDVSTGEAHYWAKSPVFSTPVNPSTQSFIIEFDINPVKPDWGNYPRIFLVDSNTADPYATNTALFPGIALAYCIVCWSDTVYQKMVLGKDISLTTGIYLSPSVQAGTGYHVYLSYDSNAQTMDWRVTKISDGSLFHEQTGLNIGAVATFDQIIIGQKNVPPKYGTTAEATVDNIKIYAP